MPETFCDTSPLQYLHQAGLLDLLPKLYGEITIPEAVAEELAEGRRRGVVLPDPGQLSWVSIRCPRERAILPAISDLGPGEREVLAIAVECPGSLAILDDALARQYALLLRIRLTGTLGVLLRAKNRGALHSVLPVLDRLEQLRFRLDAGTRRAVLKLASEL